MVAEPPLRGLARRVAGRVVDHVPDYALRALTRDDDPEGQAEPDALRSWSRARPTEEFVRQNWCVLREAWLSHDIEARESVGDQLWHLGVGEGRNCPTNKATELEFLRSCQNARRLRESRF